MKYIIVLGDGMADEPLDELGGKTPLEYADTPEMDRLAAAGEIGLVKTIPEGMAPGSDTANLSVLGYDPKQYYTGRSPLEALSIGVPMKETDIAIRCNIVTLSEDGKPYEEKTILDHSSGEITTEEADELLKAVKEALEEEGFTFYTGTSYRHLLIWDKGDVAELVPPHDILGKTVGEYLPEQPDLRNMMIKSFDILNNHPVNEARRARGLNPANSLWFWGAGTKPALTSFEEKNGKRGVMISAVDLLKGIGVGAEMKNIIVEGADGTLDTNYEGKAEAAVQALLEEDYDFVYVHVEAPDEMGHQGSAERKIRAIEYLDQRVIKNIVNPLDKSAEDYRMLVLPDHPTPVRVRTHTGDPVPYLFYDSRRRRDEGLHMTEADASASGRLVEEGHTLIDHLWENE